VVVDVDLEVDLEGEEVSPRRFSSCSV
jgi:hypothetical protein